MVGWEQKIFPYIWNHLISGWLEVMDILHPAYCTDNPSAGRLVAIFCFFQFHFTNSSQSKKSQVIVPLHAAAAGGKGVQLPVWPSCSFYIFIYFSSACKSCLSAAVLDSLISTCLLIIWWHSNKWWIMIFKRWEGMLLIIFTSYTNMWLSFLPFFLITYIISTSL